MYRLLGFALLFAGFLIAVFGKSLGGFDLSPTGYVAIGAGVMALMLGFWPARRTVDKVLDAGDPETTADDVVAAE